MTESLRLTLVRHGETAGQSSIRYHGRTDVPLSALGRTQMERARDALSAQAFSKVYASTLSRSVEAATIVGRTTAVTRVANFDEIDFGHWEGLTAEEIQACDPQLYVRWQRSGGDFQYPGGESTADLRARVATALHELLVSVPTGHLLLVLHKGVIRAALADLLRLDESARRAITVPLASIHVVRREGDDWRAEVLDGTDHL